MLDFALRQIVHGEGDKEKTKEFQDNTNNKITQYINISYYIINNHTAYLIMSSFSYHTYEMHIFLHL